jgi:hypothetical protein
MRPTLSSLIRAVLLTEARNDPASFLSYVLGSDPGRGIGRNASESRISMLSAAKMISNPSLGFASTKALADLIVDKGLFRQEGAAEEAQVEAVRAAWEGSLSEDQLTDLVEDLEHRLGQSDAESDEAEADSGDEYSYPPWEDDSRLLNAMRFIHYSYKLPGPTPTEADAAGFMQSLLDEVPDPYDAEKFGLKEYMRQRSPDAYEFYYGKSVPSPWRNWDPLDGEKNKAILNACVGGYSDDYNSYWKRDYPDYERPPLR